MRKPFVAGNWKMYMTASEARQLVSEMLSDLQKHEQVDRVVCPPAISIPAVAELLAGTNIGIGAQNMHWEASGAYTGELAAAMLLEYCQYVIIGHSERRAYFHETDETVNKKVKAALAHKLVPIVCVGETLDENEAGRTAEVVSRQVCEGLVNIDIASNEEIVVAYEPVWAIGTGLAATPEGANAVIRDVVRATLSDLFGKEIGQALRVLYGGSIKANNARELFGQSDIDGGLVGGASLKVAEFVAIVRAATS